MSAPNRCRPGVGCAIRAAAEREQLRLDAELKQRASWIYQVDNATSTLAPAVRRLSVDELRELLTGKSHAAR